MTASRSYCRKRGGLTACNRQGRTILPRCRCAGRLGRGLSWRRRPCLQRPPRDTFQHRRRSARSRQPPLPGPGGGGAPSPLSIPLHEVDIASAALGRRRRSRRRTTAWYMISSGRLSGTHLSMHSRRTAVTFRDLYASTPPHGGGSQPHIPPGVVTTEPRRENALVLDKCTPAQILHGPVMVSDEVRLRPSTVRHDGSRWRVVMRCRNVRSRRPFSR